MGPRPWKPSGDKLSTSWLPVTWGLLSESGEYWTISRSHITVHWFRNGHRFICNSSISGSTEDRLGNVRNKASFDPWKAHCLNWETQMVTTSMKKNFRRVLSIKYAQEGQNTMMESRFDKTEEDDKGTPQLSCKVEFSCWVKSIQRGSESSLEDHNVGYTVIMETRLPRD